jgi:uncharacterized protein (DUF1800 family)
MDTRGSAATAAVNRFGLGARPGELEQAHDARGWLSAQITRGTDTTALFAALPTSLDYLRETAQQQQARRTLRDDAKAQQSAIQQAPAESGNAARTKAALDEALRPYRQQQREQFLAEAGARYESAATTSAPFIERLVYFWSNHFAVSIDKSPARLLAAPMEREAIRPHVTGRFADMLVAVESHPAMLLYLDNQRSTGPNSKIGERVAARLARQGDMAKGKAGGLNENLGREAMELHSVGVGAGYTQQDVTEFARALTGWSIPFEHDFEVGSPDSAFIFRAAAHEPGTRRVMGRTFAEGGFEQGRAILEFLAHQPATARHLALKLARHFVADEPPPALVGRLAHSYLAHDTSLAAVYRTLIQSPEAWGAHARKFRTPQDFVVAALRAGQIDVAARPQPVLGLLNRLGEPMFEPRSPAGFDDGSGNWIDADALWKRVQAAEALAARFPADTMAPADLAHSVLGPLLDDDTAQAIRRAESKRQAWALMLASPAFQWRA